MITARIEDQFYQFEQLVDAARDEIVDSLVNLLTFVTVSGSNNPDEQKMFLNELSRGFSFLNGLCRDMGFTWRNYGNQLCVIEMQGGPEVVGLPLHIDVVPSGEGWHYPAFGGMVEDGVIYGRGAQDDKGPIIQMLFALFCLKQLGIPFARTVRLIIASQEETGNWSDVKSYLEREPAPDMSIVADADFPVVNGEKGMVDVRIALRWNKNLADDPALQFRSFSGGERPNVIPNRADILWHVISGQAAATAGNLKAAMQEFLQSHAGSDAFPMRIDVDPETAERQLHMTFLGKSAHGSRPADGHNALLDALAFLGDVPHVPFEVSDLSKFLYGICQDYHGTDLGIAGEHDFLGKTTASLNMLHVDTQGATAIINVRPTYGMLSDQVLESIRAHVIPWAKTKGFSAEVSFNSDPVEALYVDPEKHAELITSLQDAFARVTRQEPKLIAKGGTTFAKAFPNAVSFGPVLPGEESDLAHQADECIRIDNLIRNVKIYGMALLLLAVNGK